MPIGEFAGGHLYQVGGYGTVYIVSLFICTCGLFYVLMVLRNESRQNITKDSNLNDEDETCNKQNTTKEFRKYDIKYGNCLQIITQGFQQGNKAIFESYR